jgi:hypothetical protein
MDTSSAYATETSTSYTEVPTEMPEISMVTEWATVTVTMDADHSMANEEPCDESTDSSDHQTMMPSDTITMTSLPNATQSTADTAVVSYTVFNDMVNAANSMFKAWNPYKPAYTPSTGN